ncbi:MAG: hypothetical protein HY746_06300 [Elusimicrobia bacterium]|nr:hypothetical protein [Elusimicrobiota bacterium]
MLKKDSVYAYPNPADNAVTFHLKSGVSPIKKQILIFDIIGRVIHEVKDGEFSGSGIYEA